MDIIAARSSRDYATPVVSGTSRPTRMPLTIERVDAAGLERHEAAWADLAGRTIEPNIFLEPGFTLSLLRHAGMARRQSFLLVWEDLGASAFGRLVGLFPIVVSRFTGVARGLAHNQVCSGVPLLDGDRAPEVLETLFAWLAGRGINALDLRLVGRESPFFASLQAFCDASSRGFEIVGEYPRAILHGSQSDDRRVASFVSAKRRKEHARLSRRLSALGTRTYVSAQRPAEVADAVERFLTLEHAGWKGTQGTSFLADPARATFLRSLTRALVLGGKCRIDSIEIDGQPVAMGIILVAEDTAYFWKTTFDESHASLSPGVQFALELTRRQLADPAVSSTDSCAVTDHPMIDKIWPDRLFVSDVMASTRRDGTRRFRRSVRLVRLGASLRKWAKAVRERLRLLKSP